MDGGNGCLYGTIWEALVKEGEEGYLADVPGGGVGKYGQGRWEEVQHEDDGEGREAEMTDGQWEGRWGREGEEEQGQDEPWYNQADDAGGQEQQWGNAEGEYWDTQEWCDQGEHGIALGELWGGSESEGDFDNGRSEWYCHDREQDEGEHDDDG